jgi:MFS transporter, DHA1 family, multidrug resistance protein
LLDYAGLFRRGKLAWLTLSSAFAMAGLFAYIGSSSFVFVDHYGLPPAIYSLALAGIALGMVIGGQINVHGTPDSCFWTSAARRLLRRAPHRHPC